MGPECSSNRYKERNTFMRLLLSEISQPVLSEMLNNS